MTHTRTSTVLLCALIGTVVMGAGQWLLVTAGEPALVPPLTWGVALAALGVILLALAWPIRKHVRASTPSGVLDPFYATRVLLLSKAGALAGAGFTGVALGFIGFFVTRPVLSSEAVWPSVLALVGALVLTVSGLVAERWCTVPPDPRESSSEALPEGEVS
ncbi:MAG: hypothetical protein RL187_959 [Actinomycetota bacterium]